MSPTQLGTSLYLLSLFHHGPASSFFAPPAAKRQATLAGRPAFSFASSSSAPAPAPASTPAPPPNKSNKRLRDDSDDPPVPPGSPAKKHKNSRAAPLADRMRPLSLDDMHGQDLVGPSGVLRALIDADRVPSMILWGPSGTGKTTIARCIARRTGARFVEINATATGVTDVKRIFEMAANEAGLTGRKTIIFCDEIHRFSKTQQDIFLKPVESGLITLIGATTENPSFRIQNALLSRCRTFTLAKLSADNIRAILVRALDHCLAEARDDPAVAPATLTAARALLDGEMLAYLSAFADGDARTGLNLLDLALSLALSPAGSSTTAIKAALTRTLVYDRVGDQHYDTISAFHKSVRGSDPHAALYYLARMLDAGEDPLFIARRMVVIASEDVGLADNSLLPLATAAYTAAQQIGLPEARIPLAHCAVALSLAPKSTRAYRGLNAAMAVLKEPGAAGLAIPLHLRNAPTRLMTELGYGAEYKYPPNYVDGRVKQEYLPEALRGRRFLDDRDLGLEVDPDLEVDSDMGGQVSPDLDEGVRKHTKGGLDIKADGEAQSAAATVAATVVAADKDKEMDTAQ
ncbi:hypothetical protein TD95_000507 [Thielaviopsis punctulata]|uniref:AAA+ ATPase domain-containing protein n=1 Tax=Thielaviopsis punctulata TaxID=72032 RepID=A0A0F4Z8W6_9PEZI|nr:hypothetical protein TD95_000507 [Thielaviopsis punctulata]